MTEARSAGATAFATFIPGLTAFLAKQESLSSRSSAPLRGSLRSACAPPGPRSLDRHRGRGRRGPKQRRD
ncbi:hypothetical protein E3U41_07190 [Brevundimonas naejangsanensis]|nr:hypothetical protein E3U41_07190 [Brevundimonas naejangsanensis]